MEKDILSIIAKQSAGFSKGQKQIVNYILENYDKAAFMTAGKLGKTVGVSESTVVRFAAELGYDGYPSMRKAMQEMIRNRLTAVQRIEVARDTIGEDNTLVGVISADIERLQNTLQNIDQVMFNKVVEAIVGAKNVYILGLRSCSALSSFMGLYLNLIRENVHLVGDSHVNEIAEQVMRISGGDVLIGISFPRYSKRTIKSMEYAKSIGAQVIGITDGKASPLAEIAEMTLFANSDMASFLDSLVAPLSLINALLVSIGFRMNDSLALTFAKLETIWAENEVYEKSQN